MTTVTVSGGQTSTSLTVSAGETLVVASGGQIISTTVNSGGVVTISSGAIDSGTTISSGGSETVSSGGTASGDFIWGSMTVISTGAAGISNETVESGGVLNVSKSATLTNTTLSGGTVVLLTQAGTLAGSVTMAAGTSNTIQVAAVPTTVGATGDLAAISGFAAGDKIDITALNSAAVTMSQVTSGGNTVAEIVSGGAVVDSFIFSGTAISGSLALAADASNHAEIVYSAGPVGTTTSVTSATTSGAYTETSGNTLLVLGGGSVSAATISSGGALVANGGADYAAIVTSGGSETVSAGTASNDLIGGALTLVGGSETGAVIQAGGSATIGAASASDDLIYGALATISGDAGVLTSETVESGGVLTLANGATASGVTVLSGGTYVISGANAAANGTVLSGGGIVDLASPKAQIDGTLTFSGGGNTLEVGSLASAGYGELAMISGFSTTDKIDITAIAAAGASLAVTSSGGDVVATVTNGGSSESFLFASGAGYNGFTLELSADASGGAEIVYNPNAVALTISSGVTSSGIDVASGATLTVLSGGTASATKVESGGALAVSGTDIAALVSAGGTETVLGSASGDQIAGAATIDGVASNEIVLSGGSLVVNGGSSLSATVSAGGGESVIGAGSASGDQIFGTVNLTSGVVSGETVESGGQLNISGGIDDASTILVGGHELVLGSATGDQVYGVQLVSAATAVVTDETVFAGGAIDVFLKGGVASGTIVSSGGALNISGNAYASNTVLSGGGVLALESPKAVVDGSLVFAGGGNVLDITGTTSAGYGVSAAISGFSSTDKIDLAATAFTAADLTLSQFVSGADTVADVLSGGTVVETFHFADTTLAGQLGLISDGNGGLDLEMPPISVTTSVTTSTVSGAFTETATNTLLVLDGGSVSAATIDAGAFLVVNGGTDAGSIIAAGGLETISAGSASGDQIFGSAVVDGGDVSGETVLSGGQISIATSASNLTLSGGGVAELTNASAVISGAVTFTGGDNTLKVDAFATAGSADQAVIAGFSTADKIDLAGVDPTSATLSFSTDAAGDAVVTVTSGGASESFLFNDPSTYQAGAMSLISDGAGGADLVLDTTPVVAFTSPGGATNAASDIVNGTVDVKDDPEAVGTTVSVTEGDTVVGTATVGADGHWSAKVTFLNDDGDNVLSASDTDLAGETGATAATLTYAVDTTAAAFTPGNLVISISGDGDGSGSYGDNQASPMTLEQITTDGQFVSQLVLPQVTTVVNGVTESAISSEYGSSSEGSLQLSSDGHSLVIAGYGVNADTFNSGGAAVYGTAALAQSTSITGGTYTAVARVIADINANGVVDTSTALYDVDNLNNPRSVATVDGTTFYLSGQGTKGDTTQGVFYAVDGASTATGIYTATDTRTAMIYNGQLYVSVDSTQAGGVSGIESYGGLPTSATTPTMLQGLGGSVTLTSATANGANNADIGSSVNLSPENFFFANADTLYVADGGAPKEGGLGDGGLQKWVLTSGKWTLEYTLSAGLNLVPNTASSGTSGLIGLTGEVVGGNVELFATNETVTDLDQTYVYEITDQLSSTTGAGESFTAIMTAAAGENIRGISFAPTAYAPTITGTLAGQTTEAEAATTPFSGVTIADQNGQASETLTITLGGSGGILSGAGLTDTGGGVYTLSGSATTVTSELDALSFTATAGAASSANTTTFTLSDLSSADSTPTVDATTTLTDHVAPAAPIISAVVGQPLNGSTIEVTGTGEAGDTVTLYVDGGSTAVGTGLVGADGTFDITTTTTFADGQHSLTATETDPTNLTSAASAALPFAVDPAAPVLNAAGPFVQGQAISISGSGEVGASITLYDGASVVATGTVAGDGIFTLSGFDLPVGVDSLTATQTNNGETSAASASVSVTVQPANQTFTLTTGADTVSGGAGTNTVVAASGTLSAGDQINAGSGAANVLDLTGGGTFDLRAPTTLTGIATVDAQEGQAAGGGVATGEQTVWLRSGQAVTVDVASDASPNAADPNAAGIIIHGASDSDVIDLGSGADTVYVGSASETVNGGGGNDVVFATAATVGATLNGGTGSSTLYLQGGGTVTLGSSVSNFTKVDLLPAASGQTQPAWNFTANGIKNLQIVDYSGSNDTITLGDASQSVFTGNGSADRIIATGAQAAGAKISAAGAADTLEITTGGAVSVNAADYGVGTIVLDKATTLTAPKTVASIQGTSGGDTLILAGGALTASSVINLSGSNSLALNGGGTFDLRAPATLNGITTVTATEGQAAGGGAASTEETVWLRAGVNVTVNVVANPAHNASDPNPDAIVIHGAGDSDVINLGTGTDIAYIGAPTETFNSGGGSDRFIATAWGSGAKVVGTAGGTDVLEVSQAGILTLNAGTKNVTVQLDQASTLNLNTNGVGVTGSTGNDVIDARVGDLIASSAINLTGANNVLALIGGGTFDLRVPANLSGIATITAQEGQAAGGGVANGEQTLWLRAGQAVTVNVASDTSPNASDPNAAGIVIHGAADSDSINLGSGADTVYVGSAGETIKGGGGNDIFYATAATVGATIDGGTGASSLYLSGGGTAVMGSNITDIAKVDLLPAASGQTQPAWSFTANTTKNLQIVDYGASGDTITLGDASQSVFTGPGSDDLIIATAAEAAAKISANGGADTLEIEGGGTAAVNTADYNVTTVELAQATNVTVGANVATIMGSSATDTITAGGKYETLTGNGGDDTLIGFSGGYDTFKDTAANLNGTTIENFSATGDKIDVTDLTGSTPQFVEGASNSFGTLTVGSAKIILFGQFAATGFSATSDGGSGTLITYAPPTTTTAIAAPGS